jgi:hypothetical protein
MQPKDIKPLSNIDPVTAQLELDDKMMTHYTLGRCLAMEEVFRHFLKSLPAAKRREMQAHFENETNIEMQLATEDGFETEDEARRYVVHCGFIHAMLMMGF